MEQLAAAVSAGKASEVRQVAHSFAGASATCGMRRLTPLLRRMERLAESGNLADSPVLCAETQREFNRICEALASYQAEAMAEPQTVA